MTVEKLVNLSQIAQGIGSILTVLITIYVAFLVQAYTRKKDKLQVIIQKWTELQTINLAILANDKNMIAMEKIIYGDEFEPDLEQT